MLLKPCSRDEFQIHWTWFMDHQNLYRVSINDSRWPGDSTRSIIRREDDEIMLVEGSNGFWCAEE